MIGTVGRGSTATPQKPFPFLPFLPFLHLLPLLLLSLTVDTSHAEGWGRPDTGPDSGPSRAITHGALGSKLDRTLTPFVERIMIDHDAVSIVVGVTKGDNIIYARAFGFANAETRQPATLQSRYHMASVSKPFVATAILKLQEQGRLHLDDPVIRHLPYFRLKNGDYRNVTIRQILTHTSGLPRNVPPDYPDRKDEGDQALETLVRSLRDQELQFAPGESYGYSNVGFNCLADVITKASGMSFRDFMDTQILDPAGMESSSFRAPVRAAERDPIDWAAPHVLVLTTEVSDDYPYRRRYGGSAGLHASVLDMCRWGQMTLQNGSFDGSRVLRADSHRQLLTAQAKTPWGQDIGLGWYLQEYEGRRTILHTGENHGFSTQMILYPDEDVCIVVVANRDYSRTARLANATAEALFDLPIKPYKIPARIPFGRTMETRGFEAAKAEWRRLANDDGYMTGEWEMNVVGHSLIWAERYDEAKQVFQFNIERHPDSANVYDSYGDALLAEGDEAAALEYFRKSLEVDPDFGDPKPKIEKILRNRDSNSEARQVR